MEVNSEHFNETEQNNGVHEKDLETKENNQVEAEEKFWSWTTINYTPEARTELSLPVIHEGSENNAGVEWKEQIQCIHNYR